MSLSRAIYVGEYKRRHKFAVILSFTDLTTMKKISRALYTVSYCYNLTVMQILAITRHWC